MKPVATAAPTLLLHALAAAGCAAMLVAAGQPIFTDDLWWHLALGRAFAADGPWLAADPLLFRPAGPPSPGAWLWELTLYGVSRTLGFAGLRVLHVAWVAGILALVWSLLRRARSPAAASLGTLAFVALAAYRLVQLRPELVSIVAALLFYRLLLESGTAPSWRRVAAAVAGSALWANLHPGFLLGPLLLGAGALGAGVAAWRAAPAPARWRRSGRLAAAAALSGLATLLNPLGIDAHLAYFVAGAETPALVRVGDEWTRFPLLAWPRSGLPPSPLNWALVWAGLAALAAALPGVVRGRRRADPALAAAAAVSLAMALSAVRFLWLAVFPLLLLARLFGPGAASARGVATRRWAAAAGALLLLPGFLRHGDWTMITRGLPRSAAQYARPYPAGKYCGHAIWLMRDAGLAGNLYTEYFVGGFAAYWLGPDVRTLVNGTLNFPRDTLVALEAIGERRGVYPGEGLPELLERLEVDLFLGMRAPSVAPSQRAWAFTTPHLDRTPGWLPLYRSPTCSLFVRDDERNRANVERAGAWFAEQSVPFDARRGFSLEHAVVGARDWATAHGVIPRHFDQLERRTG